MNKIKLLIIAIVVILSFSSCSEEEAPKMIWEVSASPAENVKAVFDPGFYCQIQVTANGGSGEAILKCTNYKSLRIDGVMTSSEEWINSECHFSVMISDGDTIKLIFAEMPDDFTETTVYLRVDGTDGKHNYGNLIQIIRKP